MEKGQGMIISMLKKAWSLPYYFVFSECAAEGHLGQAIKLAGRLGRNRGLSPIIVEPGWKAHLYAGSGAARGYF